MYPVHYWSLSVKKVFPTYSRGHVEVTDGPGVWETCRVIITDRLDQY